MKDYYSYDQRLAASALLFDARSSFQLPVYVNAQFLTFNCGSSEPTSDILTLLLPNKQIYFISLQEADTDPQVFITNTSKVIAQYYSIFAGFDQNYETKYKQLGSQALFVISHSSLGTLQVKFTAVPTGNMSLSNKGGIICKLKVHGSLFCVIGCHLAADRDPGGMRRRNQDLLKILQVSCQLESNYQSQLLANSRSQGDGVFGLLPPLFHDCQFAYIMGDLNYRTESNYSEQYVAEMLQADGEFKYKFMRMDQLAAQIANPHTNLKYDQEDTVGINNCDYSNNAIGLFSMLEEKKISFNPTYCYVKNSHQYQVGEEKCRMPAYTDRILFLDIQQTLGQMLACQIGENWGFEFQGNKAEGEGEGELPADCESGSQSALCQQSVFQYGSFDSYEKSDHRPVFLAIQLNILQINESLFQKQQQLAEQKALQILEELTPKFEVVSTFGRCNLSFQQAVQKQIIISNLHQQQYVELEIASDCPYAALQRCIKIQPSHEIELTIDFLVDLLRSSDIKEFELREFYIDIVHKRGQSVIQQQHITFECELALSERQQLQTLLNDPFTFDTSYSQYYQFISTQKSLPMDYTFCSSNQHLSYLTMLLALRHQNYKDLVWLQQEYLQYFNPKLKEKHQLAQFLFHYLGHQFQNRLLKLFSVIKRLAACDSLKTVLGDYSIPIIFIYKNIAQSSQ